MPDPISRVGALAAAQHGEQYTFVQEADPGDSVWGAFWWKPSEQTLRVWFDEWLTVLAPGLGSFLLLVDTPDSYSGFAGYLVAVNGAESGLEFVQPADLGGITNSVQVYGEVSYDPETGQLTQKSFQYDYQGGLLMAITPLPDKIVAEAELGVCT